MYNGFVRTTIELKPEHRARLLELAARRGEKGFSSVIAEALDSFLNHQDKDARLRQQALSLRGCLSRREADHLHQHVSKLRAHWR
jgi:hypothetical protein